jgi:hypothetical protein
MNCELCAEPLCRACDQFLKSESFSFLAKVPEELSHTHYCPSCHDAQVAPAFESYEGTLEKARGVFIFFNTQKKAPYIMIKAQAAVKVEACADRDETILRLAFQAATLGHNALFEVEVIAEKVRNAGYQTTSWRGKGLPATIDAARFARHSDGHQD